MEQNRENNNVNKRQDHRRSRRPIPRDKHKSIYISMVIPLLNEEESLEELALALEGELNDIANEKWEVLFIDDGSSDNSYEIIKRIHSRNQNFKCIRFRRNYGKSAALAVGFQAARGKLIGTMDADLQDDPKELKRMVDTINQGWDLVSGWKKVRHDPISKTLPSKFFNYVTSKTSGIRLHDFNCGFKMYRREVAKRLQVYGEMHRYLPALAHWDGFKVTEIPVTHHARPYGVSKFGLSRFLYGFLDLLTVMFTTRYMKRPLHFFGLLGTLFVILGLSVDTFLAIEWAMGLTYLSERPLFLMGIAFIIVGVQFISMGLLGELIIKNSFKQQNYNIQERLL